jgi:sigma-B regulation protein RsbU (phosphoserine phosphatase)
LKGLEMKGSFDSLRESQEFLTLLLDNINMGVLIADDDLHIRHFNRTCLQLFGRPQEMLPMTGIGGLMGCKYHVEEGKSCGETSHCSGCELRLALLRTVKDRVPLDKIQMQGMFYLGGTPLVKYLEISTRSIQYHGREMALLLLYDITKTEEQKIQLQEKQHQIDQDLEAAAGILRALLPRESLQHERLNLSWKFEPCRHVGGDIFNICFPEENRLDLYMLDVCGHGVSSAFIAVSVSQFLRSRREYPGADACSWPPETMLNRLNQLFPFERFDTYFTIIHGSLDLNGGLFSYSCAGHPPPLIVRSNGTLEILDAQGPAIGVVAGEPFRQGRETLQQGDKLVLYTDGILDMRNTAGQMFGRARFHQNVQRLHQLSPQEFVEGLYSTARDFSGGAELEDDVSLLAIEYLGDDRHLQI